MTQTTTVSLTLGAMAPPLTEQLAAQGLGYPYKNAQKWQKCADAITYLSIHGMIPDKVRETARGKLMRMISIEMNKFREAGR